MSSCGMRRKCLQRISGTKGRRCQKEKAVESLASVSTGTSDSEYSFDDSPRIPLFPTNPPPDKTRESRRESRWARYDQLSTILESIESSRRNTPNPSLIVQLNSNSKGKEKAHQVQQTHHQPRFSMSERRSSSISPKMIRPPPRDLESISRIDASLVFEHFTTSDAWELGSSLRNRLLPIPTPVVINISLANQNQTIFHTVTHSGVMPDNESWVERKRKTVLRWGCSTWFMACKFGGDEAAFREKYGLGNSAGKYAIHGGGVPIRVTGVEGVVAVVVVSGLKQDENHAVIVEVIKDLYY